MDLYSIDKLMHETRQLAARYRQTTGNTLPVTGEIARFDVAKALDLQLIDDPTLGYDAIGKTGERKGLRILIKGRVIFEDSRSTPRIGQVNPDGRWDNIVMVLFDDNYLPVEMYEATSDDISAALKTKTESSNKKRGAMSVAQFKIIGQLVWTQEDGLESEVWDNHSD
ncbi:MAG: hypothetical protein OEY48_01480 [Gammaproteobacteria bacterium]|nr:hypothetical protein [Gammaproteobacteria bacterium]